MKQSLNNKINVAVVFGGKSVEHDISIITGVQTINSLDKNKFNVVPIYVSKEGIWYTSNNFFNIKNFSSQIKQSKDCFDITLCKDGFIYKKKGKKLVFYNKISFVYFATHGGSGENGSLQGYIEALNIPYSCCDVLSSAICMNKLKTKNILTGLDIKTTKHVSVFKNNFTGKFNDIFENIKELNYPLIVKPCSLGSSIGINYCKNKTQLKNAITFAFMFDDCVLIEQAVENLREFNIAVMGNSIKQEVSDIEEVFSTKDFLTFENKYLNDNSAKGMENTDRLIPANIPLNIKNLIVDYALRAFKNLNCKGIVRIDFLFDNKTNLLYLNEINTIPGSLANYLWKSSNYSFKDILQKLYFYGIEQYELNQKKIINFSTTVLSKFDNTQKLNLIK